MTPHISSVTHGPLKICCRLFNAVYLYEQAQSDGVGGGPNLTHQSQSIKLCENCVLSRVNAKFLSADDFFLMSNDFFSHDPPRPKVIF